METPQDDSNIDKYTQEKVEKGIQDLLEEKELKIKWRKELEQNEAVQNYFKNYKDSSIDSFVNSYLSYKYLWFKYGDMYKQMTDDNQSQWIELAHEHLQIILQKKLFDLQCLWRAEQIKIEGVSICFDFDVWEHDIFNCPFIEPINQSDIALYQEYLMKGDIELERSLFDVEWQNYEEIKQAYHDDNSDIDMPSWYEFHNLRTGNTKLLLLPDIRGDKEQFYSDLYFKNKEQQEAKEDKPVRDPNWDSVPSLSFYDKQVVSFFVKTFEDKEIQNKHNYYTEANSNEGDEYYEEIFSELLEAKEYIPIKAHYDFKEAIKLAYNEYRYTKIIAHLPMALEQYQFNIKMGFSIGEKEEFYGDLREKYVERFLDGRELNGEERTLNF
jgi:hypothetical protein